MDYGLGLTLMLIGMVTVFAILLIVIYVSKGLIWLVNKCAPEAAKPAATTTATTAISPRVKAIITATIATLTSNTGRVTSIEKI